MRRSRRVGFLLSACILAAGIGLSPGIGTASVVTSNNSLTQSLGTLNGGPNIASASFTATPGFLVGVGATVQSTQTGSTAGTYQIDSISLNPATTSADALVSHTQFISSAYGPTVQSLALKATASTMNYNLAVGQGGNRLNWTWQATNVTAFRPAFADVNGNLGNFVPNASFEDPSVTFFNAAPSVNVTVASAKHGSRAMLIAGAADKHIGVPVNPGIAINFSVWYETVVGSGGQSQIEYGFNVPADGFAVTSGNSFVNLASVANWTELSGTITPGAGQTTFYIGGMSNGDSLYFDSLFVSQVPEPIGCGVILLGSIAMRVSRRRTKQDG